MTSTTCPVSITERMQQRIAAWEASSDPRAIFLSCYQRMTENVLAAIDAGEFSDATWVRRLLHRFADYYFAALDEYEAGDPATPAVWRLAHDKALNQDTVVLQKMLLGVNAHISYDLVFALADLLEPEWDRLSAGRRKARFTDHCHVNVIIGRTIDVVQDEVVERYSPLMDLVDRLLGRLDEMAASRLISGWRDEVWRQAVRCVTVASPQELDQLRCEVEATTLRRAGHILLLSGTPLDGLVAGPGVD